MSLDVLVKEGIQLPLVEKSGSQSTFVVCSFQVRDDIDYKDNKIRHNSPMFAGKSFANETYVSC